MRKFILIGVAGAFVAACASETPVGPGGITLTSTTTVLTTTSTVAPVTTASFTVSPNPASVGQQVQVDGSASKALPGRSLTSYSWNFGDGTLKTGEMSQHDYDAPGTYLVVLTVTDNTGEKATASQSVTVGGTATTTSLPVAASAVRFVSIGGPPTNPNVPADMTLFFQLVTGSPLSRFGARLGLFSLQSAAASTYTVTGSYATASGATGQVKNGTFTGTLTPNVDGTFTGTLSANMAGCAAERQFGGPLNQTLSWTGGAASGTCSPNPLSTFETVSLTKTDLPPSISTISSTTTSTTSTSTSTSTTTSTTSTTTSIPVCAYTVTFPTGGVAAAGASLGLIIEPSTPNSGTCKWSVTIKDPSWITVEPTASGAGPAFFLCETATTETYVVRSNVITVSWDTGSANLNVSQVGQRLP